MKLFLLFFKFVSLTAIFEGDIEEEGLGFPPWVFEALEYSGFNVRTLFLLVYNRLCFRAEFHFFSEVNNR